MKKRRKLNKKTKFCPRCGSVLDIRDAYCLKCGYSFVERAKRGKKTNWKKVLLFLVILAIIYVAIRLAFHKPILPDFSSLFKFNKTG